jgi:hypothetical protein
MFGFGKEAQRRKKLKRLQREYAVLANKVVRAGSIEAAREKFDRICRENPREREAVLALAIQLVDIAVSSEPQSLLYERKCLKDGQVFGVSMKPPLEDAYVSTALLNAYNELIKLAIITLNGLAMSKMK